MPGSSRERFACLFRFALVAGALSCSVAAAAKELITYEGKGIVTRADPFDAMPVKAQVGDELRVRVVVEGDAPATSSSTPTEAFYFGRFREVSFWLNGAPLLAPANPADALIAVHDNLAFNQPKDLFFLRWSKELGGLTLFFDLELEDATGRSMLQSTALPRTLDFTRASRAEMSLFLELGINHGVIAMTVTEFTVSREFVATLPPITGEPAPLKPWRAAATESQVPAATGAVDDRVLNAAFIVHTFGDVATLEFAEQGSAGVQRIALHCAAAGSEGPPVWNSEVGGDWPGTRIQLRSGDLTPVGASSSCPIAINNIASLEAAARQRLLYLEFERSGSRLRGQLWPHAFNLQQSGFGSLATTSDQQTVTAAPEAPQWLRTPVTLWFSELEQMSSKLGYSVPNRHRFRSVRLHCAPPGEDGPVVAELPSDEGVLSAAQLLPAAAASACRMAVNTHQSVLEALARGNLYVEIELADPGGTKLRGQFPSPANGELP